MNDSPPILVPAENRDLHVQSAEKAHVEELYKKYDIHQHVDPYSKQIICELTTEKANNIEADIQQVFDGGHKFLYELLQNADDVHATTVDFIVSGGCDLFLMSLGDDDILKTSDKTHLYLYEKDGTFIYQIDNISSELETELIRPMLASERFDQPAENPVKCRNEKICDAVLEETSKRDHTLSSNKLLVSHNGGHFKKSDVNRICKYGADNHQDNEAKIVDLNKTGYKGVGFKAVFGISERVTILSGNYSFKFEKQYWNTGEYKSEKIKYPWHIIPIWVDKSDWPKGIQNENVNFYLEHVDEEKVHQELNNFFNFPEIIIFLRKVNTITLTFGNKKCELKKEKNEGSLITITTTETQDGHKKSQSKQWYQYQHTANIPEPIQDEIKELPDAACPKKIKEAKQILITFAAQVSEGDFKSCKDMSLFCYLPTEVKTKLPFLINADFLLSKNRKQLSSNNVWNHYLFGEIATAQFRFFADIAKNPDHPMLKFKVLTLFNTPDLSGIGEARLLEEYKNSFDVALETERFVLSMDNNLLTVKDSVIDKTEFFKEFTNNIIQDEPYNPKKNPCLEESFSYTGSSLEQHSKIVSYQLDNKECLLGLKTYPSEEYNWKKFSECLEKYMIKINIELSKYLNKEDIGSVKISNKIKQLMQKMIEFSIQKRSNYINFKEIADMKILVTNSGVLEAPNRCFFIENQMVEKSVIDFAVQYKLSLSNEKIYAPTFLSSLKKSLSLKVLNQENIIKFFIRFQIQADQKKRFIDAETSIRWLQFIYDSYKSDEQLLEKLNEKSLHAILSEFPVVTCSNKPDLTPICYSYFLDKNSDDQVSKDLTIADPYFKHRDSSISKEAWENLWKSLLSWLGIQTAIELKEFSKSTYKDIRDYFELKFHNGKAIDKYCKIMLQPILDDLPDNFRREIKKNNSILQFRNFLVFDLLFFHSDTDKLSNYTISDTNLRLFLLALKNNWEQLSTRCELYRYFRNGWKRVGNCEEHFLSFYFKSKVLKNGPGELIYAPKIVEIVGDVAGHEFKFARLDRLGIELTLKQAEFLGFRTYLSAKECLMVLEVENKAIGEKLKQGNQPDIARLKAIYEMLIHACESGDTISQSDMVEWKKKATVQLLSYDNTLCRASSLKVCDIKDVEDTVGHSQWLHSCGLNIDLLKKLASILHLPLFSSLQAEQCCYIKSEDKNDQIFAEKLCQFIIHSLPLLALIEAEHLNQDEEELFTKLFKKFKTIICFVYCKEINFDGARRHNPVLISKDSELLFSGRVINTITRKIAEELGKFLSITTDAAKVALSDLLNNIHSVSDLQFDTPEINRYPRSPEKLRGLIEIKQTLVKSERKNEKSKEPINSSVQSVKRQLAYENVEPDDDDQPSLDKPGKNAFPLLLSDTSPDISQTLVEFEEHEVKPDGTCGFITLGTDRETLAKKLLLLKDDGKVREFLAEEIINAFVTYITTDFEEGLAPDNIESWKMLQETYEREQREFDGLFRKIRDELSDATAITQDDINTSIAWLKINHKTVEANALAEKHLKVSHAKAEMTVYCTKPGVFEYYVNALKNTGLWLGYSSALLYAKNANITLYIWKRNAKNKNQFELIDHHIGQGNVMNEIHMLHTSGFTHFNLLSKPSTKKIGQFYPDENQKGSSQLPKNYVKRNEDMPRKSLCAQKAFPMVSDEMATKVQHRQNEFVSGELNVPLPNQNKSVSYGTFFSPLLKQKKKSLKNPGNYDTPEKKSIGKHKEVPKADENSEEKEETNKEIGTKGEQYVYEEIKKLLIEKLGIPNEKSDGSEAIFMTKQGNEIVLQWYCKALKENQHEGPVDLTLSLNGEIRYFIEVKSTSSQDSPYFFISANEWGYMKEYRKKSIFVRMYGIGTDCPKPFVIIDPFEKIFQGLITLAHEGRFQLEITPDNKHYLETELDDKEIGCRVS